MPYSVINQYIDVWKGKIILRTRLVKIPVIDTNPNLAILLRTGTTLASHSGYSTTDKKPTLSCFWISSLTCKLHRGCSLLNFYLTGLTCGRMGKWCWTLEGSRPDMSSYDHANTSSYDLNRLIIIWLTTLWVIWVSLVINIMYRCYGCLRYDQREMLWHR